MKKKNETNDQRKIFSFNSYKEAMGYYLVEKARWGQMTRAAEFLGCQVSFLTRIIKDKLQLTPDHAFNLADFLGFNADEKNYFLVLVDFERAADPKYKSHLKANLEQLKKKNESISERTNRGHLSSEAFKANYFSSWIYTALHFMVSIPKYQKIEEICTRLNLKKNITLKHLDELKEQGLVDSSKDNNWEFKSGNFHLNKNSPLVICHHQNWRTRAIIDAQDFSNESIHFTAVYTLSENDTLKLKEMMLEFISSANRVVQTSENEECVAICCDFFKL